MHAHRDLRIEPVALEGEADGRIEIAVLYTDAALTEAAMSRAASLCAGLSVSLAVIAVHIVPYPAQFSSFGASHAFLVEQVADLAERSPLPARGEVVMARTREEGLSHALPPSSTILIASRRRHLRTAEERLARSLVRAGHKVALFYVSL